MASASMRFVQIQALITHSSGHMGDTVVLYGLTEDGVAYRCIDGEYDWVAIPGPISMASHEQLERGGQLRLVTG
jgi:hypothetical protein